MRWCLCLSLAFVVCWFFVCGIFLFVVCCLLFVCCCLCLCAEFCIVCLASSLSRFLLTLLFTFPKKQAKSAKAGKAPTAKQQ